jgi:thioredoxin
MKTPAKILIVAALAAAVVTALALKKSRPASASEAAAPAPTAAAGSADPMQSVAVAAALPKLLDLGAGKCIPCKLMVPVLEQLRKEYTGRLNVEFIDVWENPAAGKAYGVEVIPVQIFYDAGGKELFRHVGFFAKEDILAKWKELGVELTAQ